MKKALQYHFRLFFLNSFPFSASLSQTRSECFNKDVVVIGVILRFFKWIKVSAWRKNREDMTLTSIRDNLMCCNYKYILTTKQSNKSLRKNRVNTDVT